MVYRIYVEKKPGFDGEAKQLENELRTLLGVEGLEGLRLLNRYDVEDISEQLFDQCVSTVFSEPPVDNTYATLPRGSAAEGPVSWRAGAPGSMRSSGISPLRFASREAVCRMVASWGTRKLPRGSPSSPITEISSGTRIPQSRRARMVPMASTSAVAKMAVYGRLLLRSSRVAR